MFSDLSWFMAPSFRAIISRNERCDKARVRGPQCGPARLILRTVARIEPVRRIVAATDRSSSADRAVAWAADMATRYEAELVVLQVLLPDPDRDVKGIDAALGEFAGTIGPYARSRLVVDDSPAEAIV